MNMSKVLFFRYTRQPCARSRLFLSHISLIYRDNVHLYDRNTNRSFISLYLQYIFICFQSILERNDLLICIPYHCHLFFPLFPLFLFFRNTRILVDYAYPLSDISGFPRPSILKVYVYNVLEKFLNHDRIFLFFESPEQASRLSLHFPSARIKVYYTIDATKCLYKSTHLTSLELPTNYLLFRGRLNKESGIHDIINGYRLLKTTSPNIPPLLIHGWGSYAESVTNMIDNNSSIMFIDRFLVQEDLEYLLSNSLAMLGQISSDTRLNYTIPHKFYEALLYRKPYISLLHPPLLQYFYGLQKVGFPLPPYSHTKSSIDKLFSSLLEQYLSHIYAHIDKIRKYNLDYLSLLISKNIINTRV